MTDQVDFKDMSAEEFIEAVADMCPHRATSDLAFQWLVQHKVWTEPMAKTQPKSASIPCANPIRHRADPHDPWEH